MKIITDQQIEGLNISPEICVKWIEQSFSLKSRAQLPAKNTFHMPGNNFFTSMPCLLPEEYGKFGVKIVSRIMGRNPLIKSDLLFFDSKTGEIIAMFDTNWITSMRTGAVAALAIRTFRKRDSDTYSFIGLGHTAHTTMKCLHSVLHDEKFTVRLLRYKDQAEKFAEDFSYCTNIKFEIVSSTEELVKETDVLVSCISSANGLLVEDESLFKPGILVVPVHTRGFQNCDLFFDKVFADDTDHVKGFKYFSQFRQFGELGDVLSCNIKGRESDEERILSYNIGLGLHDVYYCSQIYNIFEKHPDTFSTIK